VEGRLVARPVTLEKLLDILILKNPDELAPFQQLVAASDMDAASACYLLDYPSSGPIWAVKDLMKASRR